MTRKVSGLLRSAFVMLLVGGCAAGHDVAMDGRRAVIGPDADSFQACAGIPTRTKRLDPRTEILSYEALYCGAADAGDHVLAAGQVEVDETSGTAPALVGAAADPSGGYLRSLPT